MMSRSVVAGVLRGGLVAAFVVLAARGATAQPAASANFRLTSQTLNGGGGGADSLNFSVFSCLAPEPDAGGSSTSASFLLQTGCVAAATQSPSLRAFAYIPNSPDSTVSVIDTLTDTVVATVQGLGLNPIGVGISPDGSRVYVPNISSDSVSVIDTACNRVTATVPVGTQPAGVTVSPDGKRAYVTNLCGDFPSSTCTNGTVSVIDTTTNPPTLIATVQVPVSPRGIVVSPNGMRLYVANHVSSSVSVIDTSKIGTPDDPVIANVPTLNPIGLVLNPAGNLLYVANLQPPGSVSVIDTATNSVTATVALGSPASDITINPTGTRVYAVNSSANQVSVLDATTSPPTLIGTVPVGNGPSGVASGPLGTKLFVPNSNNNNVSIIDISNDANAEIFPRVPVGAGPIAFGRFIGPAGQPAPTCGNGILDAPCEQCDDGNTQNGDCCSPTCQFEPSASPCTDGNACTTNDTCNGAGTCNSGPPLDCSPSGDQCVSGACMCGSGPACSTGQECVNGVCVLVTTATPTPTDTPTQTPTPTPSLCGDGNLDPGEQCDDGNLTDCDGCDSNCTFTAMGNGIVCPPEQCDDGNTQNSDCCSSTGQFEPTGSPCDDALFCDGTDTCDGTGMCATHSGDPCAICTTCDEPTDQCVPDPALTPCDDGDPCTLYDECDGAGTCAGQNFAGRYAVLRWPPTPTPGIAARLGRGAQVDDNVCYETIMLGRSAEICGDAVAPRADGTAVRVGLSETVGGIQVPVRVDGSAVTGGGAVSGSTRCRRSAVCGAPTNLTPCDIIIDTPAAQPFLDQCNAASCTVAAKRDEFKALSADLMLAEVRLRRAASSTISLAGIVKARVVVGIAGDVRLGSRATLTLEGNATIEQVIVRVGGKLRFGRNAQLVLTGGLTPEKVLFLVTDTATLSFFATMNGTIMSDEKIIASRNSQTNGALIAARGVRIGTRAQVHLRPFVGW